jgi:hypothetical protein
MESLVKLSIAAVASETTSMDFLTWAGNTDITKRTLGTMVFQDSSNYGTIAANDLVYLKNVTLNLPSIFNVTTSNALPANPNLVAVLASQTANRVLASPNGSNGTPTFRSVVTADISDYYTQWDYLWYNKLGGSVTFGMDVTVNGGLGSTSNFFLGGKFYDKYQATGTTNQVLMPITGGVQWTTILWSHVSGKPTTFAPTAHTHAIGDITDLGTTLADKQPLDADISAIAALSGTTGLPRKTALNTWVLDTANYLTANQNISITGDATGNGTTAIALTLANVGTAGTYNSITVDAKGRVTAGTNPTTIAGFGLATDFSIQWNVIWSQILIDGIGPLSNIVSTNGQINNLSTGNFGIDGFFTDGTWSNGVEGQFLQSFGTHTAWSILTSALISDFAVSVLGQTLNGVVAGSATEITELDTILSGFQSLQAQVSAKLESSEIANYWKNGGNAVTSDWSFALNNASGTAYNYSWAVNSIEKMRLTAQGNLGVGISPEAVIHGHATVVGNAEVIILKASNTTASTSFFSIGINSLNNRTNLYAGGEVWATMISKWKFAAADVSGTWAFGAIPTCSVVPSNAAHIVNKAYVDSLSFVKKGDNVKTISLTNITLSGTQTVNGVALVANDLILVAGQTTGANNGVYVVAAGAWTRSTTNDVDAEIRGAYHFITNGTYANQRYINTNASAITIGTTAISYGIDFGAETDPIWVAFRDANAITSTSITNWNTAFSNYIANTRAVAVLGTSGRLSSSAGSQNLTADRTWTLDLIATGITAGTYKSITVDAYGRATAGTNPTTIAGFGLATDFATQFSIQLAGKTTDNLSTGTANKYYTNALFTADFNTKLASQVNFGLNISVNQTGFFYGSVAPTTNATGLLVGGQVDGLASNILSFNPATSTRQPLNIDGSTINIKVNGVTGSNGYFLKSNGTVNSWAALTVSDITNIASTYQAKISGTGFVKSTAGIISYDTNTYLTALDAVTLGTFEGERGFKLYSDVNKTFAEGIIFTNPDTGILGIHAYSLASNKSTITEFGFQIDKDGFLYHRKFDGSRAKLLTTDDLLSQTWSGGYVSSDVKIGAEIPILWGSPQVVSRTNYAGKLEWGGAGTISSNVFGSAANGMLLESAGNLNLGGLGNVYVKGSKLFFNGIEMDFGNISILAGGNAKFAVQNNGGVYKLIFVAA